jgi:hypothetical protein
MNPGSRLIFALASLGILIAFGGCGSGVAGPKTVRVSGSVILDGKPLENVEVHFISDKHAGFGKTDAEGNFKLITGAVVGENKVYFSKLKEGSFGTGDAESGMDAGQADAAAAAVAGPGATAVPKGQMIPAEYASPQATKLTFMVPEGGTDSATFDLDTPK